MTTRIITFLIGNPYNPSFTTGILWGGHIQYIGSMPRCETRGQKMEVLRISHHWHSMCYHWSLTCGLSWGSELRRCTGASRWSGDEKNLEMCAADGSWDSALRPFFLSPNGNLVDDSAKPSILLWSNHVNWRLQWPSGFANQSPGPNRMTSNRDLEVAMFMLSIVALRQSPRIPAQTVAW